MVKTLDLFDWRTVLIESYKNLGLSEEEVMIVFVVNTLINEGMKLITPDMVALKMSLDFKKVDKLFTNLIKKEFLIIKESEDFSLSLLPLKEILFEQYYNMYKQKENSKVNNREVSDILMLFENELGRPLNQFEVNTINNWFEFGNTSNVIKEALNVAKLTKNKSIRYIDKILLEWKRKEERSLYGQSNLNDKWRKNIDETIEIAKINWMEEQ